MKIEISDSLYSRLVNISKMISSTPDETLRDFVESMCQTYEADMMVMPDGTILDLIEAEDQIIEDKLRPSGEGEDWRADDTLSD